MEGLKGWTFPGDVPGLIMPEEARCLAKLAAGKVVLEMGTYCGRSTISMAQTARFVVTVDWHRPVFAFPQGGTLEQTQDGLARYGVSAKVLVLVNRIEDQLAHFAPAQFGLIFHDARHTEAEVLRDITAASCLLTPGGTWAIHDFDSPHYPGVRAAVERLFPASCIEKVGGLAIVKQESAFGWFRHLATSNV